MIEVLLEIDYFIFQAINGLSLPYWIDLLLTYWRNSYIWGPFYIFMISFAIINIKKNGKWFIVFSLLTVSTTDFVSSTLIKKNVERLRPCNTEHLTVINRVRCSNGYSFTSSHATNHFGLAAFWVFTMSFLRRRYQLLLWAWAGLIAMCQVYVGVHFPSDILAGSIIGTIIGYAFAYLFNRFYKLDS